MIVNVLILLVLCSPGMFFCYLGIADLLEEDNFKKAAMKTEGEVVGVIPIKYNSQHKVAWQGGTSAVTPETSGGFFLRIEYEDHHGDRYATNTKKVYSKRPSTVPVYYSPENSAKVMIDGFYKVGNQKYYMIILGAILGPLLFIGLLIH